MRTTWSRCPDGPTSHPDWVLAKILAIKHKLSNLVKDGQLPLFGGDDGHNHRFRVAIYVEILPGGAMIKNHRNLTKTVNALTKRTGESLNIKESLVNTLAVC